MKKLHINVGYIAIITIEKCLNESCEFAHSAIELDFVKNSTKVENLKNTVKKSKEKLIRSRARLSWRPAKSGLIESSNFFNI